MKWIKINQMIDLCVKVLKFEAIKMYINAAKLLFHFTTFPNEFRIFMKSLKVRIDFKSRKTFVSLHGEELLTIFIKCVKFREFFHIEE